MDELLQKDVLALALTVVGAIAAIVVGFVLGRAGHGRLRGEVARAREQVKRAEKQAAEQGRVAARLRNEQGLVASLALSLPTVVRELNRRDIKLSEIPRLILNLAEAIFAPEQLLLYATRNPEEGAAGSQELQLIAYKGLSQLPDSLRRVRFGEGKIGWAADHGLDMVKEDWLTLTRTDGLTIDDNSPLLKCDIVGPLVHYDASNEHVLGVLCIGAPATRPREEKLMFQLVANLGTLALVNARNVHRLRQQANTDGLTGLLNKRFFLAELAQWILDAEREAQPVSLFIFDIDHFKTYNDKNGHPAGDDLLRNMAALLRKLARPNDMTCRYGGEEFVVSMPATDIDEALDVAERIRAAIESTHFEHQEKQPSGNVTISGGVATFPKHGSTGDEILGHADEALYRSKQRGRNRVSAYRADEIGDTHEELAVPVEALERHPAEG